LFPSPRLASSALSLLSSSGLCLFLLAIWFASQAAGLCLPGRPGVLVS
jgi:hypothetical protein